MKASLAQLGVNLRLARKRRGLSVQEAAEAIGVGVRALRAAEQGSLSTAISVSVALLHHYRLAGDLALLAEPSRDLEGLRQSDGRERSRARRPGTPAPPVASPPRPAAEGAAPLVLRPGDAAIGLPAAVASALSEVESTALRLLQRNSSARTSELARALELPPLRVGGLMRELKRKLYAHGTMVRFTDERLPDGESLYRFSPGGSS